LAGVRVRLLPSDELFSLRGETLKLAMEEDKAKGFIPFFVKHFCSIDKIEIMLEKIIKI
jgi:hypothetical protein